MGTTETVTRYRVEYWVTDAMVGKDSRWRAAGWAYLATFSTRERAAKRAREYAGQGFVVSIVPVEVESRTVRA